jgi:DNA-binding response OmpR family regulator
VREEGTVLIAEDERSLRALIRAALSGMPVRVLEATTGTEALTLAQRELPNLVLLDVGMTGIDGYAVCRALKGEQRTAAIKVVMLTARAQRRDRERGIAAGADGYITKPFSPAELRASVGQILSGAGTPSAQSSG